MRRRTQRIVAAMIAGGIGVGGSFGTTARAGEGSEPPPGESRAHDAGMSAETDAQAKVAWQVMADAANAAARPGGFDELIRCLSTPAREKMRSAVGQSSAERDATTDRFRRDWKARYGADFRIPDDGSLFADAIRVGGDSASTKANASSSSARSAATDGEKPPAPSWGKAPLSEGAAAPHDERAPEPAPARERSHVIEVGKGDDPDKDFTLPAAEISGSETAAPATATAPPQGAAAAIDSGKEMSANEGRGEPSSVGSETARGADGSRATGWAAAVMPDARRMILKLPATKGTSDVSLAFIEEGKDVWRIDPAEGISAALLRECLLRQFDQLERSQREWPDDEKEAYRLVSRQMLKAIADAGGTPRELAPGD